MAQGQGMEGPQCEALIIHDLRNDLLAQRAMTATAERQRQAALERAEAADRKAAYLERENIRLMDLLTKRQEAL